MDLRSRIEDELQRLERVQTHVAALQSSLQSKTGFEVTVTGAIVAITSFFLTTGQHTYVTGAIAHSAHFVIPAVLLVAVAYSTPMVLFCALLLLAVAQWPSGGDDDGQGTSCMSAWR
jgi:hypothetical protein